MLAVQTAKDYIICYNSRVVAAARVVSEAVIDLPAGCVIINTISDYIKFTAYSAELH